VKIDGAAAGRSLAEQGRARALIDRAERMSTDQLSSLRWCVEQDGPDRGPEDDHHLGQFADSEEQDEHGNSAMPTPAAGCNGHPACARTSSRNHEDSQWNPTKMDTARPSKIRSRLTHAWRNNSPLTSSLHSVRTTSDAGGRKLGFTSRRAATLPQRKQAERNRRAKQCSSHLRQPPVPRRPLPPGHDRNGSFGAARCCAFSTSPASSSQMRWRSKANGREERISLSTRGQGKSISTICLIGRARRHHHHRWAR